MRMIGDKIECYRGEAFMLVIPSLQVNNVPFYIGTDVQNPYLCLTVKSNKYTLNGRYCKKYWLDVSNYDKKVSAVSHMKTYVNSALPTLWLPDVSYPAGTNNLVVNTASHLVDSPIGKRMLWYVRYKNPTSGPISLQDLINAEPTPVKKGNITTVEYNDINPQSLPAPGTEDTITLSIGDLQTLYYIITENGREYYYAKKYVGGYEPYNFTYVKEFINEDTKDWPNQQCTYELSYVAGVKMADWLKSVYASLYDDTPPKTNVELAHYICKKRPDVLKDVDITDPLASYTINEVLLGPNKLIVKER